MLLKEKSLKFNKDEMDSSILKIVQNSDINMNKKLLKLIDRQFI